MVLFLAWRNGNEFVTRSPELHFSRVLSCVARRDYVAAREHALAAAAAAEDLQDCQAMLRAGDYLERFNEFGNAGRLMARGGRYVAQTEIPEWDGTHMPSATLLIEQRIRDIAAPIRMARLAGLALRYVGRCITLIDHRLVALYSRSFPRLEVVSKGTADADVACIADVVASFETLMQHLAPNAGTLAATFSPLRPNTQLVASFRERYRRAIPRLSVVGVSWVSTNRSKDLPPLKAWAQVSKECPRNSYLCNMETSRPTFSALKRPA